MQQFICPICKNKDSNKIGIRNGKPYCRLCLTFKGKNVEPTKRTAGAVVLDIKYPLSKEQKAISNKVIENYKNGIDTLINAVCGAGKTELVYGVIAYALSRGQCVAFAIPRRDVVIELIQRIKSVFPSNKVVAVFGGNTKDLNGDIVVLTTHQLFRYPNYFDLIVLDEIDAFPFKNDQVLRAEYERSLKGHSVLMSATPSNDVIEYFSKPGRQILELNTRFHRHPLPVPKLKIQLGFTKTVYLINKLKKYSKENKPCFVFVPTVEMCEELFNLVKTFAGGGNRVHSKCPDRSEIIQRFKDGKYKYLVTTAVLERGVTIKNLQIIVYQADHKLYDEYTLIQIAGRVGRKIDAPEGEAIFLADKTTVAIENAINTIESKNKHLQSVL